MRWGKTLLFRGVSDFTEGHQNDDDDEDESESAAGCVAP